MRKGEDSKMSASLTLSTERIWGVKRSIENLRLSPRDINWSDYYQRKTFLRFVPYDVPKKSKPESYGQFIRFASECASAVAPGNAVSFVFASKSSAKILEYCKDNSVVFKTGDKALVVQHFSAASIADFLLSGCIDTYRAAEAYVTTQKFDEVFHIRRKNKNWFQKFFPSKFKYFFLFHLEKPVFYVWFMESDREHVNASITEMGKSHKVEIAEEVGG